MITQSKKAALSLLLFSLIFGPIPVFAQQATSTIQSDGSAESAPMRRQRIRGWRDGSSELQQKINALSSTTVTSVPIPILFGVERKNIFPNFGDPRDGGARTHEGEDIMAIKGTPIVSPSPAVVLRTGTGGTEGNYVYTANPGGETFVYMHLDRIGEGVSPGVVLSEGSLIGYAGNTGNASGGAAHLHFEIHNNSGTAIDPFPRLTTEFSLVQKISFLSAILTQTSDVTTLAQFLVTNFRATLSLAAANGIVLPSVISSLLVSTSLPSQTPPSTLPTGDLALYSNGPQVASLQRYLMSKNTGPAASRLAVAGATGSFGPLTLAALIEYQKSVGITPADGYYGPVTHAVVLAGTGTTPPPVVVGSNLTRDLSRNMTGQDVLYLQKFLNSHGFLVSSVGAGSVGNETTFFGGATQSAVIKFQIAQGISPSVGYVGPLTRAAILRLQ